METEKEEMIKCYHYLKQILSEKKYCTTIII